MSGFIKAAERRKENFQTGIEDQIKSGPGQARACRILISASGIGPVTAAALLCQLPEPGRIEPAAHAGAAPFARDSGAKKGASLYMEASAAARFNKDMSEVHDRLTERGG